MSKSNTVEDLSEGEDCRGDFAMFIDEKHIIGDGWQFNPEIMKCFTFEDGDEYENCRFFRIIKNGHQQHGHGWTSKVGKIEQWG